MTDADLVIVGGGIMGLATAWAAASRGASTVLIDPRSRENDHNASNDESKVFRFAYADDEGWTRMAMDALDGWRKLERESGRRLLHRTGLFLFPGPFADATEDMLKRLDEPAERVTRAGALEGAKGGVLDPNGGWLDPPQCLAALEERALARGLDLRRGVAATRIDEDAAGVTVALSDGATLRARAAVVAAGFHAPALVPLPFPITVTRQVELFFEAPPELEPFPTFAAFEEGFYGFPPTRGAVKVADHRKGPVVTDFDRRAPPTADEVATARAWLARRIPDLAGAPLARWRVCLYDNAPDDRFLVGAAPGRRRTLVAAGFSGHGFKFAPEVGARLAAAAALT